MTWRCFQFHSDSKFLICVRWRDFASIVLAFYWALKFKHVKFVSLHRLFLVVSKYHSVQVSFN